MLKYIAMIPAVFFAAPQAEATDVSDVDMMKTIFQPIWDSNPDDLSVPPEARSYHPSMLHQRFAREARYEKWANHAESDIRTRLIEIGKYTNAKIIISCHTTMCEIGFFLAKVSVLDRTTQNKFALSIRYAAIDLSANETMSIKPPTESYSSVPRLH